MVELSEGNFNDTEFSVNETSFDKVKFSGEKCLFDKARFSGEKTYFKEAEFSGRAYFNNAVFSGQSDFNWAIFYGQSDFDEAIFSGKSTSFHHAKFCGTADFYGTAFSGQADFSESDFKEEVTFDKSIFPSPEDSEETSESPFIKLSSEEAKKIVIVDNKGLYTQDFQFPPPEEDKAIPIKFDYCTFRKRVQFIGASEKEEPLQLGLVSFKGVDLSNVEFHNVKWQNIKEMIFIPRDIIADEQVLDKKGNKKNYEEVKDIQPTKKELRI